MASTESECRIPKALQAVFLASNQGNDVHEVPPKKVAFTTFIHGWISGHGRPSRTVDEERFQANTARESKKKSNCCSTTDRANQIHKSNKNFKQAKLNNSVETGVRNEQTPISPQEYLDNILEKRGYSNKRYNTLTTAYHNKPTPLQIASYDLHLIELVKQQDTECLTEIFESGISANPCSRYGESLLNMVCRLGADAILQVMIENGCRIQVADDYGRTPLHYAFWKADPDVRTVELLLQEDLSLLLMADCRGFLPLAYTRKSQWKQWIDFLETRKDMYWPETNQIKAEFHLRESKPSHQISLASIQVLAKQAPNSNPLPDPVNALPLDLASMVASGTIRSDEASYIRRYLLAKVTDEQDHSESSFDSDETEENQYRSSYLEELEGLLGTIGENVSV